MLRLIFSLLVFSVMFVAAYLAPDNPIKARAIVFLLGICVIGIAAELLYYYDDNWPSGPTARTGDCTQ